MSVDKYSVAGKIKVCANLSLFYFLLSPPFRRQALAMADDYMLKTILPARPRTPAGERHDYAPPTLGALHDIE